MSSDDNVWERIQNRVKDTPDHELRHALEQALWNLHLSNERCSRKCAREIRDLEGEVRDLEYEIANKHVPNEEISFELARISDQVCELELDLQRSKEATDRRYQEYFSSSVEDGFKNLNRLINNWTKSL